MKPRLLPLLLGLAACAETPQAVPSVDAAGASDVGGFDAAARDATRSDRGEADSGPSDLGSADAGDAGSGTPSGQPDAGAPDALVQDAGPPDAGAADMGTPEAGPPDAGPTYACADLPANCPDRANWSPGLREHHMVTTDGCKFALQAPTDQQWRDGESLAAALAQELGGAVSLNTLLGDLNRAGRPSVTNQTAQRLRNHNFQGWIWNDGDNGVSYWYPQGITGSSDAYTAGPMSRRRLQLISWYHKTDSRPTKGVRVSMAEIEGNTVNYRHLLLVVPSRVGGQTGFKALHKSEVDTEALHAGGIVWFGPYLYVADTANGFRVFDMRKIARVNRSDDASRIGRVGRDSWAHNYRYIVPQVARYDRATGACPISFSFVGLDRSSAPPTLLSGEYKSAGSIQGRLVHWNLDPVSNRLESRRGLVFGQNATMGAQTRMQGALSWQGNTYISSSSQWNQYGRLYGTRPGRESNISAWVYGCEDLYYERSTGIIWTTAEHPNFRDVVGIPLVVP